MRAVISLIFLLALSLSAIAKPPGLFVSLTTDKKIYRAGQPVTITVEATNKANSTANLLFGSGQSYDILVTDAHKKQAWRWSRGRVFTMAVRNVSLPAGKSLKFTSVWKPARPGKYFVRGRLTSANPLNTRLKAITVKHD